jgi:MarR family transcriptional regulator, organic hydroperoxide resistance regulator
MDDETMDAAPLSRIEWLSDLIRLEITLWNRVDTRLRAAHGLPLAFFWPLYVVGRTDNESLRVGELARELGLTVGGTSKIVDRIAAAGFLRREPDALDRRASRVVLTPIGRNTLEAASRTYEAEMTTLLDAALSAEDQQHAHRLIRRLLEATDPGDPATEVPRSHLAWDAR